MSNDERVKLTLSKYYSTWNGKLLKYLQNYHPGKKGSTIVAMECLAAMWMPFTMRFHGATEAECQETAAYSVRFLLSHVCSLMSEFGLSSSVTQGFGLGGTVLMSAPNIDSSARVENVVKDVVEIEVHQHSEEEEYEDDEDNGEIMAFPQLNSGFNG